MKKFNLNIIVFVICILFVVCGYNPKIISKIKSETKALVTNESVDVSAFTSNVENILSERVNYHSLLMDVNSIENNLQGTRIISKEDTTVVKTFSGKLASPRSQSPDKATVTDIMENEVGKYSSIADNNDAQFLSVIVPPKAMYETFPDNVIDCSNEYYDLCLDVLDQKGIPSLHLAESFRKDGIVDEDIFFFTDHHWTPYIGFLVNRYICEDLHSRYGMPYDDSLTDIDNYDITTYENQFLGSYGKKVGTFFSWHGADDFDLIMPKFETSLTEEQPFKGEIREGTFQDTVLFMDNLKKDYYKVNTYVTYCGGDYRLQIIKNHLNEQGPKIVLIRDSYACVVAPFLALQASELHIVDLREGEDYVGEMVDVEEYVGEIQADYVIVIN